MDFGGAPSDADFDGAGFDGISTGADVDCDWSSSATTAPPSASTLAGGFMGNGCLKEALDVGGILTTSGGDAFNDCPASS